MKHPVYLLWGLTAASRPNAEDVLAGQVATGAPDRPTLRMQCAARWQRSPGDTALTAGLVKSAIGDLLREWWCRRAASQRFNGVFCRRRKKISSRVLQHNKVGPRTISPRVARRPSED